MGIIGKILSKKETEKMESKLRESDETYELAKDIAKHLINKQREKELFHEKISTMDYLEFASEIRGYLRDEEKRKELEAILVKDFKNEIKKYGVNEETLPFLKRFASLGFRLHEYNIDLNETASIKEVLLDRIINTSEETLNKCAYEKDSLGNVFSYTSDMVEMIGKKENILRYLKNMLPQVNDIYEKGNEDGRMEFVLKSNIENIEKNSIDKSIISISLCENDIFSNLDEESIINSLEAMVQKIDSEEALKLDYGEEM